MPNLFWKIFLSFLGSMALILVCVVMITFHVAVDRFELSDGVSPGTIMITAARVLETRGVDAFGEWLRDNDELPAGMTLLAINSHGEELLGRPLPRRLERHRSTQHLARSSRHQLGPPGPGPRVRSPDGQVFRLMLHEERLGPFGILGSGQARWLVLGTALLVAAVASYLLARYLSAPVRRLQAVTRELASGNLSARAGDTIGARRDEIGVLGRDFDAMAARLETLLRSQRELLRNISHELRSPLARITVALGLARRKGGETSRELDRIELETERLDALIGDVLRLASLDRGAQQLQRAPTDIGQLVDDVVADANFEANAAGKQVRREGQQLPLCSADAAVLRSAIENIVRNAVRYAPEGSEVLVTIGHTDDCVQVTVRDHGPGVREEDLAAIFEPFYRVAEARDRNSGGQGLGLAIANACVKLHGGTLTARNATDSGLLVELSIPVSGGAQ